MTIQIFYATNSGGTQMASEHLAAELRTAGQTVDIKPIAGVSADELNSHDLNIFTSCTWDYNGEQGMPHNDWLQFMEAAKGKTFEGKKVAIMGLGDSSYQVFTGSVDHLEKFAEELKLTKVAESLRVDGYYFDQGKNDALISDWAKKIASGS